MMVIFLGHIFNPYDKWGKVLYGEYRRTRKKWVNTSNNMFTLFLLKVDTQNNTIYDILD